MKTVTTVETEENKYTVEKDAYGLFRVSDPAGYCGTYPTKKAAVAAAERDFLDFLAGDEESAKGKTSIRNISLITEKEDKS